MRVISSVIVHGNKAVQSVEWQIARPLGSVRSVLEAMDRYELDEILLLNARRDSVGDEDFAFLAEMRDADIMTPLAVGGGVRTFARFEEIYRYGIERVCLTSALLLEQRALLQRIQSVIGLQGVVGFLPYKSIEGEVWVFNPAANGFTKLTSSMLSFFDEFCDEIIFHNVLEDGRRSSLDPQVLLDSIAVEKAGVILSGGIKVDQITEMKARYAGAASAIAIENCLSFYEQPLKMEL